MPLADASLPLQKAFVAKLKADVSMVAGRVYDGIPASATTPYISLGAFQVLPDNGGCLDGAQTIIQVDGWSTQANGATVEVKQLGTAIAASLDEAALSLDAPHVLVDLKVTDTLYMREPDGITTHTVVTVTAHTEPRD